eukprot:gnl/Spiro4/5893_TR3015_c0_g1_i1.p1 gnl/Spiro4/5893_TR3015_c0_g1~~gnl/Spiro4/5893_TR3015_c0_g1_i1.p1  ORF type:complete len:327 (+),score=75.17 gnl/Spiro4/5893_TR3015_c0_g1_i1:52-981(+)
MAKRARLQMSSGERPSLLAIPNDLLRIVVEKLIFSGEARSALAFMSSCSTVRNLIPARAIFDVLCLDAWLTGSSGEQDLEAVQVRARMVRSILEGTARWFESGEYFVSFTSLRALFAASLHHFGYAMLLPADHPQAYSDDPQNGQFPPDVVCEHECFLLDCDECAPAEPPRCTACATELGHFTINTARYCAGCMLSRRLLLGIWYTARHRVAPREGYGSISCDFSVRALGWDDSPPPYEEDNLATTIEADTIRDDSSADAPGPVLLYSAQGDSNYYIWFLEIVRETRKSEDDDSGGDDDDDDDDDGDDD